MLMCDTRRAGFEDPWPEGLPSMTQVQPDPSNKSQNLRNPSVAWLAAIAAAILLAAAAGAAAVLYRQNQTLTDINAALVAAKDLAEERRSVAVIDKKKAEEAALGRNRAESECRECRI